MESKSLTEPSHDENFWAVIALVRFLLAFIILIFHTRYFTNPIFSIIKTFTGSTFSAFFMISGYSIASSVGRKPRHFYKRRLWRIYPAYIFGLFISFLPLLIYGQDPIFNWYGPTDLTQVIGAFFLMQGILVMPPSCNSVIWSLGVIETYYYLAPLFQKAKPWMITALIIASATIYASNFRIDNVHWLYSKQIWGFPMVVYLWVWLLGFAFYRWRGNWRWPVILLPPVLFYFNHDLGGPLNPLVLGATGLILTETVKFRPLPASLRRMFLYLGDLTYPMYLVQKPMMNWVVKLCGRETGWLQYIAIFLVSGLVLRFIVRPSRRIGGKSHIDQVIDSTMLEAKQESRPLHLG